MIVVIISPHKHFLCIRIILSLSGKRWRSCLPIEILLFLWPKYLRGLCSYPDSVPNNIHVSFLNCCMLYWHILAAKSPSFITCDESSHLSYTLSEISHSIRGWHTHIRSKGWARHLIAKSKACIKRGFWKCPLSKCSMLMHSLQSVN